MRENFLKVIFILVIVSLGSFIAISIKEDVIEKHTISFYSGGNLIEKYEGRNISHYGNNGLQFYDIKNKKYLRLNGNFVIE